MDVVVTVPKKVWKDWLEEGDLAGEDESGRDYWYEVATRPNIEPGERVYIVTHGKLRGYAPLVRLKPIDPAGRWWGPARWALVRRGGAKAVTILDEVPGFRGYRYRWWDRDQEVPFPGWKVP